MAGSPSPTSPPGPTSPPTGRRVRGAGLGLPADGPGSLAPTPRRLVAFLIDAVLSALVASIFVTHHGASGILRHAPGFWSLVPFAIDYIGGMLLAGRTIGMRLLGLRIIRIDADAPVGPIRAVTRTALLILLVPAVVFDRDGRGLQDRVTDTAVIRH